MVTARSQQAPRCIAAGVLWGIATSETAPVFQALPLERAGSVAVIRCRVIKRSAKLTAKFRMEDKKLASLVQKSARISDALSKSLGGEAVLNDRERLAMVYFSVSLDHREAILLLVQRGAYTSATALQRPLLEAFVTGSWLDSAATEQQLQDIMSLKLSPPKFETMAQRLRKTHAFGSWFEVFRKHYEILGDYAHGHRRLLSRWISPRGIEPSYSAGQMAEVLRHSDLIGLMAAIHRETLSKRPTEHLLPFLEDLLKNPLYEKKIPPAQ